MCLCVYTHIYIPKKNMLACLQIYLHMEQNDWYLIQNSDYIGCYIVLYIAELYDHKKRVPGFL